MSQKIYIVEDEPDIRETLKYNFSNEGFEVFTAPDGEEALSNIKKVLPDVLILDLMLPGVSGLDVCKSIRADDDIRDMSIIMLTAKGEEIDRVIGFELGADDYVTKPFSVRELILRVKVLLKKQRESLVENKLVTFGPIRIDLDAHELKINDKEIVLTALEFKLLQHLVKRKGRVQTREQLLGDVWGYSAEVTTRTVDTHIKRLREKLGNTSDYIQTIRGCLLYTSDAADE